MTIELVIRSNDKLVQAGKYAPGTLMLPNVGEYVTIPGAEERELKVSRRLFQYEKQQVRVTLDCQ